MQISYPQFIIGDKKSLDDFGLYTERHWKLERPAVKRVYVSVPARDGDLDMTEALAGEPRYNDRLLTFPLYSDLGYNDFLDLHSKVKNYCHGQRMKIVLPHFTDRYLMGRISVENYAWEGFGTVYFEVICEPWLYAVDDTRVYIELTEIEAQQLEEGILFYSAHRGTLTNNGARTVFPLITNDYPIGLSYSGVNRELNEGNRRYTDFFIRGLSSLNYEINVNFNAIPAPVVPTAPVVALENVTKTSFTVNWTRCYAVGEIQSYGININGITRTYVEADKRSWTMTGLEPETDLYVYVFAVSNNEVVGNSSETLESRTLDYSTPTQPTIGVVGVTENSVQLSWTPSDLSDPVDGEIINSVQLYMNGDVQASWGNNTTTSTTVTGLNDETTYSFYVIVTSAYGKSNQSNTVTATTWDNPAAPTDIVISNITDIEATVSWTDATSPDGIRQYALYLDGDITWVNPGIETYTYKGLTAETSYQFDMRTFTNHDVGGPSSGFFSFTTLVPQPPNAPTGFTASSVTNTSITLTWNLPGTNYGISYFTLTNITTEDTYQLDNADQTAFTVAGLTSDTSYTFTLTATDINNNTSNATTTTVSTSNYAPPTKPTNLRPSVAPWYTQLQLLWDASNAEDGIKDYTIRGIGDRVDITNGTGIQIIDLQPSTTYTMIVTANSTTGLSTDSDPHQIRTRNLPASPVVSLLRATNNSITLTWTIPDLDGAEFREYQIRDDERELGSTYNYDENTWTYEGLVPNREYAFTVVLQTIEGSTIYYAPSDRFVSSTGAPGIPSHPGGIFEKDNNLAECVFGWRDEGIDWNNVGRQKVQFRLNADTNQDGGVFQESIIDIPIGTLEYTRGWGSRTQFRGALRMVDNLGMVSEWGPELVINKPASTIRTPMKNTDLVLYEGLSTDLSNCACWQIAPNPLAFKPTKNGFATVSLKDETFEIGLNQHMVDVEPATNYSLVLEVKNNSTTADFTLSLGTDPLTILSAPIEFSAFAGQNGTYLTSFTTQSTIQKNMLFDMVFGSGTGSFDLKVAIYDELPQSQIQPTATARVTFAWQEAIL